MISAAEALERLRDGNRRFVSGTSNLFSERGYRPGTDGKQQPFAVVLACSDSRVPVELVFDQGPGDLFVTRVAGNVTAPSQIGSVEFAAAELGARLVVVLGHSNCGAVDAAVDEFAREVKLSSPNLRAIVDRVQRAIEPLMDEDGTINLQDAVVANVRHAVAGLRQDSIIIRQLISSGDLTIVGAQYSLETGDVEFLDD